jgi:hypothetical protein
MNPTDELGDNNKKRINERTKAIAALPMAGIVVAAALMSGIVSLIGTYQQPAIAQEGTAGTNATTAGTASSAGGSSQSGCTNATTTTSGGASSMGGNSTSGTNATSAAGGNQSSISQAIMDIRDACMALQNNDIQNAMMRLNSALTTLEGNISASHSEGAVAANTMAGGSFTEEEGGRSETTEEREQGGTSPGQSMAQEEQ